MFIYKNYTQETLNQQYNNRFNVPDHELHLQQWEELGKEAEATIPFVKNISYGDLERETLDIFPSTHPNAKVLVFIHGGYWYKNAPSDFYMIAKAFRMYGITTVLIGYPLMPDHSLDQLVESCGKAIAWIYKNIGQYKGDRDQIYVSGHSAGGHLAAMMMTLDWKKYGADLPADLLKGVCAISGLYNLLPVQLCYVNENLHLDEGMVNRNSTAFLEPVNFCPLRILVGGKETAEYKAQSREMYDQWLLKNKDSRYLEIDGADHFSILATMLQTGSSLHLVMKQMMEI